MDAIFGETKIPELSSARNNGLLISSIVEDILGKLALVPDFQLSRQAIGPILNRHWGLACEKSKRIQNLHH
jgi:hypothetical protein